MSATLRVAFLATVLLVAALAAYAGITTRVSVASDGAQGDSGSCTLYGPNSISADGRYVAFESYARNLISGDTNGFRDIFVHDRKTGGTERVNVASNGTQANEDTRGASISADGRYVAFFSLADNLASGDTNDSYDVFVHDRQTGATEMVSVTSYGAEGNNSSGVATISADGRYVVFASFADNLVPGDTNGYLNTMNGEDIFVHDRKTGATERVNVAGDGAQANSGWSNYPTISADGRYVVFWSAAINLVPGDTNGYPDVFVRDRLTGATERVSVSSDGAQGNAGSNNWGYDWGGTAISADGRFVAFDSLATNLVPDDTNDWTDEYGFRHGIDVFVRDRQMGTTERVSVTGDGTQGNDYSECPFISADGRYVAFMSVASNLVPGDTAGYWRDGNFYSYCDVFVHDRMTGAIERVSVASDGTQANNESGYTSSTPSLSADGRYVAFWSAASNLVPGDTNQCEDVFVYDHGFCQPDLQIRTAAGSSYAGNDIYNLDGTGQSKALDTPVNTMAAYICKVQNDGDSVDSFKITAPAMGNGWTANYFNAITGGTEITAQVTGAGWNSGQLSAGASRIFRVEVTPDATVAEGTTNELLITAASITNSIKKDAVLTITRTVLLYKPDLQIRTATEPTYTGNDIYNLNGADQSKALGIPLNTLATYIYKIQNDGFTADSFNITAPSGGAGWMVRYFAPVLGEITAQVTGAGWSTPTLAKGASTTFWVSAWYGNSVDGGVAKTLAVTATSVNDPTKKDVTTATTTPVTCCKADVMVRASVDSTFMGNDYYNMVGYKQTRALATPIGSTVTYFVKAQNDGNSADSFTLTAPAGSSGWTVNYFNSGGEITSQITGAGWNTGMLARMATTQLWVTVKPDATVTPGNAVLTLSLTQTSDSDNSKQDLAMAVTTAILYQPDLWIRNSTESVYDGNNVYSADGSGESRAQTVAVNTAATYLFVAQNDGTTADTLTLTGTAGGSGWTVRYFAGGVGEITAAVTGAGWNTPSLAPGGTASLWATVTPNSSATGTKTVLITATSAANMAKKDVVKADTTVMDKYSYRPDLWIRTSAESEYVGDNIYNTDGSGQSKSQTVPAGVGATYFFTVQNDGGTADSFTITGPAGAARWIASYFAEGVGNITTAVTVTGWNTPVLAPGATVGMWVTVTLNDAMVGTNTIYITATSVANTAKKDVIAAATTKQ